MSAKVKNDAEESPFDLFILTGITFCFCLITTITVKVQVKEYFLLITVNQTCRRGAILNGLTPTPFHL